MDKRIFVIVCLLVAICVTFVYKQKRRQPIILPPPQQAPQFPPPGIALPKPPNNNFTFEEAVNSVSLPELKKNLEYLASPELEGRMSGKKGNETAAEFIQKQYQALGFQTEFQRFRVNRVNPGPKNETGKDYTQNIIAWIDGSDPALKDQIVVIGAHMDHIGYGPEMSMARNRREIHPGADDNASGTVALLEIARAFSKLKPKRTVVFQSYSAEEMGLIGSRYYCDHPLFPKSAPDIQKHIFMLNMDMVGMLGKGYFDVGFFSGDSSLDISALINRLDQKYSFAKKITTQGRSGSDHASFYNKKIPIAFLHTGMHNAYHTPDDTPAIVNYEGIEKIARYAFELCWFVANADVKPVFNYGAFQEMDYTHDHGHPGVEFYIHKYHRLQNQQHGHHPDAPIRNHGRFYDKELK